MHEQYPLSNGETDSLENLLQNAKRTLLYFYPKDMTPGCTKQAQWLRDHYPAFQEKGIQVIGVSRDDIKKHERFVEKYNLPFILIADVDSKLCEAFDVIKEKSMFGVKYQGIVRSSFLLDSQGNILESWRNVKLNQHFKELESIA